MPRYIPAIPPEQAIVERDGKITAVFRWAYQAIVDACARVATRAVVALTGQTAAIATTTAWTTDHGALFEVSWYFRKTVADGAASSLQMTIGWTDLAAALTAVGVALATDTNVANQSGSFLIRVDGNSSITFAVAYTSTTPNKMTYDVDVAVKEVA